MDRDKLAHLYALVRILGCDKDFNSFSSEFEKYYNEATKTDEHEPSKAKVFNAPF